MYLGEVESSGGSDGGGGSGVGGVRNKEVGDLPLPQALCLPVSSHEILASLHDPQDDPHEDPQDQVSQSPVTSQPFIYLFIVFCYNFPQMFWLKISSVLAQGKETDELSIQ